MTRACSRTGTLLLIAVLVVATASTLALRPQPAYAVCRSSNATPTASGRLPTETPSTTPTATPEVTSTATESATAANALIGIISGTLPPLGGGWGTFSYCGGTFEELLQTTECPTATAAFFYNKPDGTWAVWIPGATVAAVNSEIKALFPSAIPEATIFTARCTTVGVTARTEDAFAESLLLQKSDLTKEWIQRPSSGTGNTGSSGPNPFSVCVPATPAPLGVATSPTFTYSYLYDFIESIAVFASDADAAAAVKVRDSFAECIASVMRSGASDTSDVRVTSATVTRLVIAGAPAGTSGNRIAVTTASAATGKPTNPSISHYDFIFFFNGRVAASLLDYSIVPMPATLLTDIVQRANSRISQQVGKTSPQIADAPEDGSDDIPLDLRPVLGRLSAFQ